MRIPLGETCGELYRYGEKYIKLLEKYDVNQLHHEIMGYALQYKSFMPWKTPAIS